MLVGTRHLMIQLWYVQDPTNIQDQLGAHAPANQSFACRSLWSMVRGTR